MLALVFILELHFQLDDYPSNKYSVRKAVDYDVPYTSIINDDQVYLCCGLLELEK